MEGINLGDYTLLRCLGFGALGAAYLAQHRFLKRSYVVKILDAELAQDADFVNRFEREAAVLAALEHPHIVKVHNVSEADGRYFLVTDPVVDEKGEAMNLFDYCHQKRGSLSEEEIVSISHQIASALDYTHEKGESSDFAHQGLKPTNILLLKKKEGIHVQISDFGLSKVMGPSNYMNRIYKALADRIGKTSENLPPQNLSFLHHYLCLAPEQKWDVKAASGVKGDTYAFGVLLYFLLTGKYPEGVFELPSQISPQYKLPWDSIVRPCLNADPLKRPGLLKTLLKELTGETSQPEKVELKPVLKPGEIKRPEYEPDPAAIFQTETVVARYQPEPEEKKQIDPLHTEMVVIPGGAFERGSNKGGRDEMPRHQITLSAYAIDTHPVTNEQFVQFLEAMGGEKDHNNNDIIRLRESRIKRLSGKLSIESGYSKHPVVGVTYYGAVAYAKWVGKRLPTEAEWEIAACGSLEECIYPTGKDIDRTHANFFSSDTTPVMSYPPNEYGLYDMAGNVYEWCQDWYDYHYYNLSMQEPHNPKGPLQGVYRVLRGGCWKSLKEDLRCSHRHRNNPGTMNGTYGFRCATDATS
ncbi:MAG: SUMF1/EgtB/PvdO family nonheme iron enzyme [Verrucomicrobia bacterium]|nr:SUMF1/EgtB/PvdO family nonheme iron enzyme [Verrucomicrobiota bacterium]